MSEFLYVCTLFYMHVEKKYGTELSTQDLWEERSSDIEEIII